MSADFDTLILLIGTNPLPNFVVAQYFLKTNAKLKKIIFICSERTKHQSSTEEYAVRIEKLLRIKNPNRGLLSNRYSLSDISSASAIFRDLENRIKKDLKDSQSIHLNYTGGTKSMGIHVYRFLLENFSHNTTFSYLDARTFQIVDDREGRITDDLRKQMKLTISDILALHDFERANVDEKEFTLKNYEKAIDIFRMLIEKRKLESFYNAYRELNFKKIMEILKNSKYSNEKLKDFRASGILLEIDKVIPENLRLFRVDGTLKTSLSNDVLKYTVNFFNGIWLEYYAFQILSKHAKNYDFSVDIDWKITKRNWQGDLNFQLDLILIKGYQLVGISCTTSEKKDLCKGKGFEIFMRTRQIGGEESKAILITRLSEDVRLQAEKELQVDTGGSENILVLGEDDLKEELLVAKVAKFLK